MIQKHQNNVIEIEHDDEIKLITKSRNNIHLIALIAEYLENEFVSGNISELEAISYIFRKAKINKEFLIDEVAA